MKKKLLITAICTIQVIGAMAQKAGKDEAVNYQQERMVFKQWDKNKFKPTPGFLYTNPLYWLTWGLMPSYKNTDRRPLSATGPQTQRLAITAAYDNVALNTRLQSDTVRQTAEKDIARTSGLASNAEPLWILYYSKELSFVVNGTRNDIIASIPTKIRANVLSAGTVDWYNEQIGILRERLQGARNSDMDRGSRILAFHRMLLAYRSLHEQWLNHLASFQLGLEQEKNRTLAKDLNAFTSGSGKSDKQIAKEVVDNSSTLGGN